MTRANTVLIHGLLQQILLVVHDQSLLVPYRYPVSGETALNQEPLSDSWMDHCIGQRTVRTFAALHVIDMAWTARRKLAFLSGVHFVVISFYYTLQQSVGCIIFFTYYQYTTHSLCLATQRINCCYTVLYVSNITLFSVSRLTNTVQRQAQ